MTAVKKFTGDMTEGKPLKLLLIFAFPILIGNVFQQLYNVVDSAVIGHYLGDVSYAAVGATASIYNLVIGFANGMTNGFAVILARFCGRKDEEGMRKTVALIFVLTGIMSVILTAVSMVGVRPLLEFLDTPPEIIAESERYLRIILMFTVVTMLYNMLAAMLRAVGNSRAPLYFLIIATALNVVLDIAFVSVFNMGVEGVACATVIAQALSAALCLVYIVKKAPILLFKKRFLRFEKYIVTELITTGLSMGLMYAIVSIGSVALQRAVNSFGADTIAAHTAARKIDDIFMLPLGTISMAASTFASQNYGAGKMDRVRRGIYLSVLIGFIWSAISNIITFFGCNLLVSALTGSEKEEVLSTAARYIHINLPFFFILSVLLVLRSCLQGIGRKLVPLTASAIELVFKFAAVGFLAPALGYFGVCIVEPIIWSICGLLVAADFVFFFRRLKKRGIENV